MDLNEGLRWLAALGGVFTLVAGLGAWRAGDRLWSAIGALIVAISAAGFFFWPSVDGIVSGSIWAALVVLPGILTRQLSLAAAEQRHRRAAVLARALSFVHPSVHTRSMALARRAALLVARGDDAGAQALFARAIAAGGPLGERAKVIEMRTFLRWGELVRLYRGAAQPNQPRRLLPYLDLFLRSLGEVGERRAMLAECARSERVLASRAASDDRMVTWLLAFAFAGRVALVERLLAGPLSMYAPSLKAFWLLTARIARGDENVLREITKVRDTADASLRRGLDQRLANAALLVAEPLTGTEEAILERMALALDQEIRFGGVRAARRPIVVLALLAANVAAYAYELSLGDTMSSEVLTQAGALYTPMVIEHGDWWRLLTCTFLHAGTLHIVMNMLGLYVLGPAVEQALGRAKFLLLYSAAGLTGSAAIVAIDWLRFTGHLATHEPSLAVGASGSIMASSARR